MPAQQESQKISDAQATAHGLILLADAARNAPQRRWYGLLRDIFYHGLSMPKETLQTQKPTDAEILQGHERVKLFIEKLSRWAEKNAPANSQQPYYNALAAYADKLDLNGYEKYYIARHYAPEQFKILEVHHNRTQKLTQLLEDTETTRRNILTEGAIVAGASLTYAASQYRGFPEGPLPENAPVKKEERKAAEALSEAARKSKERKRDPKKSSDEIFKENEKLIKDINDAEKKFQEALLARTDAESSRMLDNYYKDRGLIRSLPVVAIGLSALAITYFGGISIKTEAANALALHEANPPADDKEFVAKIALLSDRAAEGADAILQSIVKAGKYAERGL